MVNDKNKLNNKLKINQKKVSLQPNKHKTWLIAGISIAVIAVLVLFLYSPAKEALFGKAASIAECQAKLVTCHEDCGEMFGLDKLDACHSACDDEYAACRETIAQGKLEDPCNIHGNCLPDLYCDPATNQCNVKICQFNTDCPSLGDYVCKAGLCVREESDCANDYDDDFDGKIDCDDLDCADDPACKLTYEPITQPTPIGEPTEPKIIAVSEICNDGIDNDLDNLIDCDDPDCAGEVSTAEFVIDEVTGEKVTFQVICCQPSTLYSAGTGCSDPSAACVNNLCIFPEVCTDKIDNDFDGLTDCDDTDCLGKSCGVDKVCITSSIYGGEQDGEIRYGCCNADQCVNVEGCFDFLTPSNTAAHLCVAGDWIFCDSGHNGNKAGDYVCDSASTTWALEEAATDSDSDGIPDSEDLSPCGANAELTVKGCRCLTTYLNIDGDWSNGCEARDRDSDTILDANDNCPDTPNPSQEDADGDGTGDACEAVIPVLGDTITVDGCVDMSELLAFISDVWRPNSGTEMSNLMLVIASWRSTIGACPVS